jgi:NAD(P)-dependent dehydrogenase (short-subunit alcohol dehydrogenase family)
VTGDGRMAGRACLIVGGTSGIGLASARRFLQEGARVVVTGHTHDSSREAVEVLRDRGPVWSLVLDARDPAAVESAFTAAKVLLGDRLDVLFHVAGMSGRSLGDGPLHEATSEGWDSVLNVNARSTFLTNRAAVRVMRTQDPDGSGLRGTVLNMGSVLAASPSPEHFGTIAYAASKGAIRAMTLACAAQYAPERIRFNLLVPGLIDTPMAARAVADPTIRAYLATKQPLSGGPGDPADCAEAAVYLCEPASRFVTGVELKVDGGWSVSEGRSGP